MRALLLFLEITVLCSACTQINTPPTGFYSKEILLSNFRQEGILGKLNMYIPSRYDTLLDWFDESDCGCCGQKKYRLLNKSSCLIQESGFSYSEVCTDSFDRLGIVYQCKAKGNVYPKIDSSFLHTFAHNLESKIHETWVNGTIKWKAKKIIHIDHRPYLFLHFVGESLHSRGQIEQIYAGTFFNKTLVLFIYENNQRDCTTFIREAYISIASIKLSSF